MSLRKALNIDEFVTSVEKRKLGYTSVFLSIRIPLFALCKFETGDHLHDFEKCLFEFNFLLLQGSALRLTQIPDAPKAQAFLFPLSGNVADIFNL